MESQRLRRIYFFPQKVKQRNSRRQRGRETCTKLTLCAIMQKGGVDFCARFTDRHTFLSLLFPLNCLFWENEACRRRQISRSAPLHPRPRVHATTHNCTHALFCCSRERATPFKSFWSTSQKNSKSTLRPSCGEDAISVPEFMGKKTLPLLLLHV